MYHQRPVMISDRFQPVLLALFVGCLASLAAPLFGQQNPQFSQYLQNPFVVNPGMTGVESYLELTAAYRNQWTGFEGAPKTATFSFNTPTYLLSSKSSVREDDTHQGVGAFVYTDDTGPIKRGGFYGSYAYHLKVSDQWLVSLGTFIGATQFKYDASEAVLVQNPTDILIQTVSSIDLDMSLGVYLYSDYLFAGIAANHILNNEIPYEVTNNTLTTTGRFNRNFNLLLGSRIPLNDLWEIVPSTFLKAVSNAPIQWDINSKLVYDEKFWGGLSYRNQDAIVVMAGLNLGNNFLLSYSYDWSLSDFSGQQSGTHEIVLGYRFQFGNQKCGCPQYSM